MDDLDPRQRLAQRLRNLRTECWPDLRITQPQLAQALGGVSVPLISSWESVTNTRIPPVARLDDYARLFATSRSFDTDEPRQLGLTELTEDELRVMNELKKELRQLRKAATQETLSDEPVGMENSLKSGPWCFAPDQTITIVCAQLPQHMIDKIPYANSDDPDYIELLSYSELDSMFELHGHLRAANPASDVFLRLAGQMRSDDFSTHLAILGGIDWNVATTEILGRLDLPVKQVADWSTEGAQYFEVEENGKKAQFRPVLEKHDGTNLLRSDVALFARGVNPFNQRRTVTICSGMYGRGSYGCVRALTDANFRDRNSAYLKSRFGESDSYCILTRIPIVHGATLTPDWSLGDNTLFEWSQVAP
ncbi:MAG TPA: helix-turn-helix transcriptional regulator [Streptosporangiaceae bacterium]|nr:helix-turn-helix transcriptional regulator [Streptosporangiaceae bacterium]